MRGAHGVTAEKLLFSDPPIPPAKSLVMVGSLELESMRVNGADLVASRQDGTAQFREIPGASHVSILFKSSAMRAAQQLSAQILSLPSGSVLPSHRPLYGALAGFVGILLIAGPFLREIAGKDRDKEISAMSSVIGVPRLFTEFAPGSVLVVFLLRLWVPLKAIRLFQFSYLASFLLLLGVMLVGAPWTAARAAITVKLRGVLAATFAGLVLLLLATAWFELTFSEAWLTAGKWVRFPFLLAALLPYHIAEETLLGPSGRGRRWPRIVLALSLRLISL